MVVGGGVAVGDGGCSCCVRAWARRASFAFGGEERGEALEGGGGGVLAVMVVDAVGDDAGQGGGGGGDDGGGGGSHGVCRCEGVLTWPIHVVVVGCGGGGGCTSTTAMD